MLVSVYRLADASPVKLLITQRQQKHKLLIGKLKTSDYKHNISYCLVVTVVRDVLETLYNTCTPQFWDYFLVVKS